MVKVEYFCKLNVILQIILLFYTLGSYLETIKYDIACYINKRKYSIEFVKFIMLEIIG